MVSESRMWFLNIKIPKSWMSGLSISVSLVGFLESPRDHKLVKIFSWFREVIDSEIVNDCETRRLKRFGFLSFKDEKSMRDAIRMMNMKVVDGRSIIMNEAHPRGSKEVRKDGHVLWILRITIMDLSTCYTLTELFLVHKLQQDWLRISRIDLCVCWRLSHSLWTRHIN